MKRPESSAKYATCSPASMEFRPHTRTLEDIYMKGISASRATQFSFARTSMRWASSATFSCEIDRLRPAAAVLLRPRYQRGAARLRDGAAGLQALVDQSGGVRDGALSLHARLEPRLDRAVCVLEADGRCHMAANAPLRKQSSRGESHDVPVRRFFPTAIDRQERSKCKRA
jgi:hypothetical protein